MQPSLRWYIGHADPNRDAAGALNFSETVLIGQVIADKDGTAPLERLLRQQRLDGSALVVGGRLELDHHFSFLHCKIAALLEVREKSQDLAGKLRALAKMDGKRRALVLEPDAVVGRGKGGDEWPHFIHEIGARDTAGPVGEADICAVQAGGGQRQRIEDAIEVGDRPAAHKRDGAARRGLEAGQEPAQMLVGDDLLGPAAQLEQSAIDVEEIGEELPAARFR